MIMEEGGDCFHVCVWDLIQLIMLGVAKSSKNSDFSTLDACVQKFPFVKYSRQIILKKKMSGYELYT